MTAYEKFLKDLTAVTKYRAMSALSANALSQAYAQGSQNPLYAPDARQVAIEAMENHLPKVTADHKVNETHDGIMNALREIKPIDYGLKALESGPGKFVLEQLSRTSNAVGGLANESVDQWQGDSARVPKGQEGDFAPELKALLSSVKEGFNLESTTLGSDTLRNINPNIGDKTAGVGGFALDVVSDPLTYVGLPGLKALKAKKGVDLTEEITPPAAASVNKTATISSTNGFDTLTKSTPDVVKLSKDATDNFLRFQKVSSVESGLKGVPTSPRSTTDLEAIPAPFKTVNLVRTTKTPIKTATSNITLGIARAIKSSIINTPSYKVGGKTIEEYLRAVRAGEIPAEAFDKNLNKYVQHILKTKQHGLIPRGFNFVDKTGKNAVGAADFKKLSDLFASGKIPERLSSYSEKTDEFTHKFAVHDPEELNGLFLTNSSGKVVSLKQYLDDLGLSPVPYGRKTFEPVKPLGAPRQRFSSNVETFTKKTKIALPELRQWVTDHAGTLSAKETRYLAGAKTEKIYRTRLQQIAARTITKDFSSIDEFVSAAKSGLIPQSSIDKMLAVVGVKNIDQLSLKVKELTTQAIRTPRITDFKQSVGKVEKTKGPVPDARWDIERIIEEVSTGKMTAVTRPKPQVTTKHITDLVEVLPKAIVDNLVTPQMREQYPFVTKIKGAKRTHNTPGMGRARNLYGWGALPQYETWRGLIRLSVADFNKQVKSLTKPAEKRAYYAKRPTLIAKRVLDNMRLAEQALRESGVKLIAGNDNAGVLISMMDVIDSLSEKLVLKHLFGPKPAQVYPTSLLNAAASLSSAALGRGSMDMARVDALRIIQESVASEEVGNTILTGLEKALPDILTRVKANYAEHAIKVGEAATSMTDEVIETLIRQFANPNVSIAAAFQGLMTRQEMLAKIGHTIKAPADALTAARDLTDIKLSAIVNPGDLAEAQVARTISVGADTGAKTATGVKQQASRASEAKANMAPDDIVNDLGDDYEIGMQWGIARANVPILDKIVDELGQAFSPHYGHADLHHIVHVEHNITQSFARTHRAIMQEVHGLAQIYAKQTGSTVADVSREAWRIAQKPSLITGPLDPTMTKIVQQLTKSTDMVFGGTAIRAAPAVRNGIFTDHFNKTLDYVGVPGAFRFERGVPLNKQADAWTRWEDIADPLDMLDKIHGAFQKATIEVTIGRDFSSNFGKVSKLPGHVKIVDNAGKNSIFPFIDSNLYYPKEIANQLVQLDKVMKATYTNTAPLTRLLDKALHAWKAGMTIYRPGHHIRNGIGDIMFNWLGGVNDIRVYHKAIKVMSGRAKAYQSWDGLKALQDGVGLKSTEGGTRVTSKIKGKSVEISDDAVWRGAFDNGLLPDFRVLEDININELQGFSSVGGRSITQPLKGKGREFAGHISMSRDHYTRLAHFINELQKGNYSSMEEAFQKSSAVVRKWHPDGADLTAFERKYMRRLIPFYSWMRKAIPLVIESVVMKPGKVMIIPKAMYNFAVANGVDPESLANPFPTDQLFPSWMTQDIIGPQWRGGLGGLPGTGGNEPNRYHGMNPGDPVSDLLSGILGASPDKEILGSLNPLVKSPIELSTGNYLGTGASITNKGEYFDQQVPGLGYVANITNRSPGSGFAPQTDVIRGNQQPGIDSVALANWLTGLGIRDYSKPNYISGAQQELKKKLGEKLRNNNGR
jgi:hypothetical protein